jgi:hypothetical protein
MSTSFQQPADRTTADQSQVALSDFIEPAPSGPGETIRTLRRQELERAIRRRRKAASIAPLPENADECRDLVGLALSGGGIRSAVYNLGLLQSLSQRGLLRHVDYLCSVSGGGYIGGHLAALADNLADRQRAERRATGDLRSTTIVDQEPESDFYNDQKGFHNAPAEQSPGAKLADLGVDSQGKLLPDYHFRHVGEYLFFDPLQFVWRYIVCTIPTVLLAASTLGVVATIVALLWRLLDLQGVRDVLDWTGLSTWGLAVGLGDELPIAFLPCLLPITIFVVGFALFVIGCWTERKRLRSIGGSLAKWGVLAGLVFLGCSLAIFLGNGETNFGGSSELVKIQQYLTWPLAFITFLFLVPMVRFRSVVNSAREGAPAWQAVAARFLIGGACTLTPFFLVHWMGRENISGFTRYRDPELLRDDVTNWGEFLRWWGQLAAQSEAFLKLAQQTPPTELSSEELERLAPIQAPAPAEQEAIVQAMKGMADHLDQHLGKANFERHAEQFDLDRAPGLQRVWHFLEWPVRGSSSAIGQNLSKLSQLRRQQDEAVAAFNLRLGDPQLTYLLHRQLAEAIAQDQLGNALVVGHSGAIAARSESRNLTPDDFKKYLSERLPKLTQSEREAFEGFWRRARGSELDQEQSLLALPAHGWREIDIQQFNRLLLEVVHPEFIRQRAMISTWIVPGPDQYERLRWLVCWAGILLFSLVAIDFNQSSPFFIYYRDRLHQRFLQMPGVAGLCPRTDDEHAEQNFEPSDHRSSLLKNLTPWRTGAPYPLFLGSLHLFDRISPEGNVQQRDAVDADRCLPFLFSPLYCGSVYSGFRKTKSYCCGKITVAEAVAISGAAVTPFMTNNSGLLAMMATFNLRIGKWIPRPDQNHLCSLIPVVRPIQVAWEWLKACGPSYRDQWRYGLAADGGFHEFFGLEELLLRRCRLIIVSDAGCNNGKFEFGAFADTIRLVRERHGIQFLDLDHEQPVDLSRLRRDDESKKQEQHHLCLRVRYPDDFPIPGPREALVVYAQMSLTGDEPLDLQQFRKVNPNFPDEPTTNQSYDENQVESFRQLGYHVGEQICQRVPKELGTEASDGAIATSTEAWIDWLRWGYMAACAEADGAPDNSLATIDPLAEGESFNSHGDLRWRTYLQDAQQGLRDYLASPHLRQRRLARVSQLLNGQPLRSDKLTRAGYLAQVVLACHDLRGDSPCADRRDLFHVGGRRSLLYAVAVVIARLHEEAAPGEANECLAAQPAELHGTLAARCDLVAEFYRLLCRGVFCHNGQRTAALATVCLLNQFVFEERNTTWSRSLDCVDALVQSSQQGRLWETRQLILSWYSPAAEEATRAATRRDVAAIQGNGHDQAGTAS